MICEIKTVPVFPVESCIPCYLPEWESGMVNENDPACLTLTDFQVTAPVTIESAASIDFALRKMIDVGVRLLLVTDTSNCIVGGITSYDIQGEKPVQYAAKSGSDHNDILVGMIMTPLVQMPAFDFEFIQRALVRHLIAALRELGQQHVLVIEYEIDGRAQVIRGLFSTSQISKMLGWDINEPQHRAHSLTDIQQELGH